MENYMLPCLNKKLLGIECFGCGTQRSMLLLCKGNFAGAFHTFPAIYTTIILVAFIGLHCVDNSRDYLKPITAMAILNALIMVTAYFYKLTHF